MFCSNCGSKNQDNAKFCTNCGALLQNTKQAEPQPQPAAADSTGCIQSIWADLFSSNSPLPAMTQGSGKLSVFPDRLVFAMKFFNVLNGKRSFFKHGSTECPYTEILSCSFTKRLKVQPSILLRLRSGESVTFAGNCSTAEVETIIRYIRERIVTPSAPERASSSETYRFVMRTQQAIVIPGQGIAALGRVEKGSVRIGSHVRILDQNGVIKAECSVTSLAVRKVIFEEITEGTDNAALLLSPLSEDVLQPQDLICIPAS